MSKHTPGPWSVDGIGMWVYAKNNAMRICDIRGWGHLTGRCAMNLGEEAAIEIQQANARLIAAAPDLLEACHEVKNFLANLENGTRRDDPLYGLRMMFHKPLHAVLDSAIAKAEGVVPENATTSEPQTSPEANAK